MQIYDFEKNRKKIKIDLENRLTNNKEKLDDIKKKHIARDDYKVKKSMVEKEEDFNLEELRAKFMLIENKVIGVKHFSSNHIYKSICNENIDFNKFVKCEFNYIKFENCTFIGCEFKDCEFNNVHFSHCNFYGEEKVSSLFNEGCAIKNSTFYKTNMRDIVFVDNEFTDVKFITTNLRNGVFYDCIIKSIILSDCDLKSMKTIKTDINILNFEDEYISKMDENTFIDILKLDDKDKGSCENIFKAYKNISAVFEKNRLFNHSGEYYYLAKCAERRSLRGLDRIKSNIFYYSCGYGERPTFALISSLEIVLLFSVMYMFSGLCINERIIHYNMNILHYLPRKLMYMDFIDCFYFSLVTFTSVGYGDIFPIGYSVIFSCIEMIMGVTMVGVWTATLARKITR